MKIRLLFFAILRERLGSSSMETEIGEGATVGELWEALRAEHTALRDHAGKIAFAVNQAYVDSHRTLQDNDEVAFIPPVSGGSPAPSAERDPSHEAAEPMLEITEKPIDLNRLVAAVSDPRAGVILTFLGTTRNKNQGREVTTLEYEAYPGMAVREMERIATEAVRACGALRIAMAHRIGTVAIGELSVAIAVSASHRDAAYTASRFAIDRLKEIVPIWKKEHFDGGEVWIGAQQGGPRDGAEPAGC